MLKSVKINHELTNPLSVEMKDWFPEEMSGHVRLKIDIKRKKPVMVTLQNGPNSDVDFQSLQLVESEQGQFQSNP